MQGKGQSLPLPRATRFPGHEWETKMQQEACRLLAQAFAFHKCGEGDKAMGAALRLVILLSQEILPSNLGVVAQEHLNALEGDE